MKLMQDAMDDRREHDAHDADEYQTTKERVGGGEYLCGVCFDEVHRSHASENHRGFEQRINPRQPTQPVVARDADEQDKRNDAKRHANRRRESLSKNREGRQLLMTSFVSAEKLHRRY